MSKGAYDLDEVRSLVRDGKYSLTKTKAREPVLQALGGNWSQLDPFVVAVAEALDDGYWTSSGMLADGRTADAYIQQLPHDTMERFGLKEAHRQWYVKIIVDRSGSAGSVAFISIHPPMKGHPVRILNHNRGNHD